jgi:hypothetical protein
LNPKSQKEFEKKLCAEMKKNIKNKTCPSISDRNIDKNMYMVMDGVDMDTIMR